MKIKTLLLSLCAVAMLASCSQSKPEKTIDNLKAAIRGELTASAKYAAFAQKAGEEGYADIHQMFQATSQSEAIHAQNHIKVLEGLGETMEAYTPEFTVGTTAQNLESGSDGETYEFETMYPEFIKVAEQENVPNAVTSFTWAMEAEISHDRIYDHALARLNAPSDAQVMEIVYYVCPKCGNTYDDIEGVSNCGLCAQPSENFIVFK